VELRLREDAADRLWRDRTCCWENEVEGQPADTDRLIPPYSALFDRLIRFSLKLWLSRLAGASIFSPQSTFGDEYAYHRGGRGELQFNVGKDKAEMFRHGVAFSFEPSRSLPDPEEALLTSVRRFNEFIALHSSSLRDMSMWEWDRGHRRDSDRAVGPIRPELVRRGMFIFLGKMQPTNFLDVELIVRDLDRLLPLYRFVEGQDEFPILATDVPDSPFVPGCTVKRRFTTASATDRILNVDLRHNELQYQLYSELCGEYGKDNVATEWRTPTGNVDVVVRRSDGHYWFYEIKTSLSARGCIREGLSQVLEYAYWRPAKEPQKVFIVGEPLLDEQASQYLWLLGGRFGIPIGYRQCALQP